MTHSHSLPRTPLRVAVTGGTSGLGLRARRGVRRARRRASPSSPATPTRVARVARGDRRQPRHRRRRREQGRRARRSRCRSAARSAASTCSSTTRRASARCRSRCSPTPSARTSRRALATNVLGPFRLTKALLGALAGVGARAARGARALVVNVIERRRGHAVRRLGRLRREQGRARAHEPDLARGAARRTASRVVAVDPGDMDTPLHAAAVPDADPATLKRPRDAAREIVARDRSRARGARRASTRA